MTRTRNNPTRSLAMQRALAIGPLTYDELAAISGLSKQAVTRWITEMREAGVVYTAAYRHDARGRPFTRAFAWGDKPDVLRPGAAMSSAQRMAALRARRKAVA